MLRYAISFMLLPLLASCAPPPHAAAPLPPTPAPRAAPPVPIPLADRYSGDWSVDDLTHGEWRYSDSGGNPRATFTDTNGTVMAIIACGNNAISLGRSGIVPADTAVSLRVRNSFALRELSTRVDLAARLIYTSLDARDPLWDQIAYSNGRFLIEASHQPPLIMPTRAAVSRVIEDCRG
ncbi:MAG: hypothetical protein ABL909_05815 [Sphingopyxis sp.]